ncbi:UNVERIFIED_ORG: tetratricopeptide (TPR) repeat protein [Rhizobium aethiopicum]
MAETCWTLLQIAPTQDENDIRRAYARRLRDFRPDEDPEGFQRLVGAKEAALNWASAQHVDLPALTIEGWDDPERNADLALLTRTDAADDSDGQRKLDKPGEMPQPETPAVKPAEFSLEIEPNDDGDDGLVFVRLNEIVAREKGRPWGTDPAQYEAQPWIELFDLAAGMSLQRHELFLEAIGREFPSILPQIGLQGLETVREFAEGHGISAVVEAIEQQCRFGERPATLVHLCGQETAMIYFSWLAHAQSARSVLQRRAAGRAAYSDGRTGMPVFPAEDRLFALETAELVKFHKETVDRGRWPFRIDFKTLVIPTTRLVSAGLAWQGGLFLLVLAAIAMGGFSLANDTAQISALAAIPVLFGGRIAMAFLLNRLAVGAALQRVMYADRLGLWSRKPRPDALRNNWREYERPIFLCELFVSLMVLVSIPIAISNFWQLKDDLDKPVETVVSELVVSALNSVASDDRLPDSTLFDLIDFVVKSEQTNFSDRGKDADLLVRDVKNRGWLAELRRRQDQLLGESWLRGSERVLIGPTIATVAAERERKLRVLADLYHAATPEARMQIERSLASWKLTLNFAKDPQTIAAVWAAIPPRSNGSNLDAFPEEMRRLLISKFLSNAIGNFVDGDVQLASQFHWLLTAPADRLYDVGPLRPFDSTALVPAGGNEATVIGGDAASGPPLAAGGQKENVVARYSKQQGDRPASEVYLPALSRMDAALARSSYFDIARTCFDATSEKDRLYMREVFARSLANPPDAAISSSADLWLRLGRAALAEPACYRMASVTGRVAGAELPLRQVDDQFDAIDDELDHLTEAEPDAVGEVLQFVVPQEGIYSFTRNRVVSHAHFLLGNWFLNKREYRSAILEYDKALKAKQCNEFYVRRGEALRAAGDEKRANADFQLARETSQWCLIGGTDGLQSLRTALEENSH